MIDHIMNADFFREVKFRMRSAFQLATTKWDHVQTLAWGIKFFIDWLLEDEEGIDWVLAKHPVLRVLRENEHAFVYRGSVSISSYNKVSNTELYLVSRESLRLNQVSKDCMYTWIGRGFLNPGDIVPGNLIEEDVIEGEVCTNPDCENAVSYKWCVQPDASYGKMVCNHCAMSNNDGDPELCSQKNEACNGCPYHQPLD